MNPEAKEAAEAIGQMIGVNLAVIQILEEVWKHGYQQGVRDCSEDTSRLDWMDENDVGDAMEDFLNNVTPIREAIDKARQ